MVEPSTEKFPRRFIGLILASFFLVGLLATAPALAATVSVSATENNGPVSVTASATFYNGESGTVRIYRDSGTTAIAISSGTGSASCSTVIDGAVLSNGVHTVRAVATDSQGSVEATATFNIENPESVTCSVPAVPQAPMDVTGTAQFLSRTSTENYTGQVKIFRRRVGYTDWSSTALNSNTFYEPQVTFSSQNMGGLIDVATWINCDWEIKSVAIAPNNATKEDIQVITIDNPISISSSAPSKPTAPMDVTGTARFIARKSTEDYTGQVKIYRRRVGATYWSSTALSAGTFYEPQVNFSSQNMSGLIDVATWINCDWEIKSVAIAPVYGTKEDIQVITIDNPISISSSAPSKPTAPMDVTGTARFIARKSTEDYTGEINIYRRKVGYTYWSTTLSYGRFYEPQVTFSSQNMSNGLFDVATWENSDWEIRSVAIAPVYGTKEDIQVITIDNTPKITASCPRYVSGDFDITGSAVFTETLSGNKGTLYIKIDSQSTSGALTKTYVMGDSAGFSYSEMAGQMLNADTLGHGEHVAYIRAQAKNGVWSPWLVVPFRTGPPEADGSGNLKIVTP